MLELLLRGRIWIKLKARRFNQFDINRPDKPAHLNFGGGVFSCIGRFAVTIEIEEVIAYMAAHFPALKITKSVFAHSAMFTSVTALEAVLDG